MTGAQGRRAYTFGPFRLDPAERLLVRGTWTRLTTHPGFHSQLRARPRRRLLLVKPAEEQPKIPLVVVQNWFSELRDKVGP